MFFFLSEISFFGMTYGGWEVLQCLKKILPTLVPVPCVIFNILSPPLTSTQAEAVRHLDNLGLDQWYPCVVMVWCDSTSVTFCYVDRRPWKPCQKLVFAASVVSHSVCFMDLRRRGYSCHILQAVSLPPYRRIGLSRYLSWPFLTSINHLNIFPSLDLDILSAPHSTYQTSQVIIWNGEGLLIRVWQAS